MANNVTVTPAAAKMVYASGATNFITVSGNISGSSSPNYGVGGLHITSDQTNSFGVFIHNKKAGGGNQYAKLELASEDANLVKFHTWDNSAGGLGAERFGQTVTETYTVFEARSASNQLYLASGGNVGIGTVPAQTLHVEGTLRTSGKATFMAGTLPTNNGIRVNDTIELPQQGGDPTYVANAGVVWVKSTSPTTLWFTASDGTDTDLTAGGGGDITGSIGDNYIPIGTAADTIGNFVLGLTENDSIWIGSDPSSTTSTASYNTALGINALSSITTGDYNVAVGKQALDNINTGERNVGIGWQSGKSLTDGSHNVGIGMETLRDGTSHTYNVAIGYNSMLSMGANVNGNVAVGAFSLYYPSGNYNTAIGYGTIKGASTGTVTAYNNVGVGREALGTVTSAYHNVAVGFQAGYSITEGHKNVAMGSYALDADTTGHSNTALGYDALTAATVGSENVAIGAYAGKAYVGTTSSVYGGFSVFIGHTAGLQLTGNASYKGVTLVGHAAGYSATGANNITGLGASAFYYADGASESVAVGRSAGSYAKGTGSVMVGDKASYRISGNYNTAIGYTALSGASSGTGFGTATQNVAIGREAMLDATTAQENVVIGNYAAAEITGGDYNVAIGHAALRYGTTTNRQVAIGYAALSNFTQDGDLRNVAVGMYSMLYPRSGSNNIAMGYGAMQGANSTYDSDYNVALGSETLFSIAGADNNTAVGFQTMRSTTDATNNTAVGIQAMYSNTTGINNTAVGASALYTNVDGDGQTAIGYKALISSEPSDGGGLNTAVGFEAGHGVTTGHSHVILGYRAARSMSGGERNIYIGAEVGYMATDGSSNTIIGNQASYHISGASNVTSIGRNAGYYISGNKNTFVGTAAGRGNTGLTFATQESVAIGRNAMYYNSTANYNVAVGNDALQGASTGMTGDENVAIGRQAMLNATTAERNTVVGNTAAINITTGHNNNIFGHQAGYSITTGFGNVLSGYQTGKFITDGVYNTMTGVHAGLYETGDYNTFMGHRAGEGGSGEPDTSRSVFIGYLSAYRQSGASYNVAIGGYSAAGADFSGVANIMVGYAAGQEATTANANTLIGYYAGSSGTTHTHNTMIGNQVGQEITTGSSNIFVGSNAGRWITIGHGNVGMGYSALNSLVEGDRNVAIGMYALSATVSADGTGKNVAIGHQAGNNNTTGTGNVFIGNEAGANSGHDTESNKLVIANTTTTTPLIEGDFSSAYVTINGNLNTHNIRPITDNTYTLGTATLRYTAAFLDDYIEINSAGATTNHAAAGRYWVSGTTPYFNNQQIQLGAGTFATIDAARWDNGTSSSARLAMADYGAVANGISTAPTAGYLEWDNSSSTLLVRRLNIGGAYFALGGQAVTDIKISSDSASTSDSDLVTAGYVNAHAGGGSPGGSDTQIQFNNGGAFGGVSGFTTTDDGSDVTLTSATASKPVFTIENTNADNNPSSLVFYKNTASPASSDQVGSIKFNSKEATSGDTKTYWEIQSRINDPTNTTPNGQLNFYGLDGDSPGFIHQFQFINSQFSVLNSDGIGPTISPTGTNGALFKSAGSKMRLQAKSDGTGEIHMIANNVGVGHTSPSELFHVQSANNTLALFKSTDNRGLIQVADDDTTASIVAENSILSLGLTSQLATTNLNINSSGDVGIGTTTPSRKLQVVGRVLVSEDIITDSYVQIDKDGSPGLLIGEGGDADIYYDGTNMVFNAARAGSGKELHITTVHASGASFQKDLGEALFIRAIHGGFDQNAVLAAAPNIQYVAPAGPSAPGSTAIPTELPLAESGMEGLEITVMQTWAADPTAALQVQVSAGSSDVIYEGGSNSASANVSVAAYRGANKTFIITATGVWVVKG